MCGDAETGREIYENQRKLIDIVFKSLAGPLFWVPGSRYVFSTTRQ
jgi:hypothetical protein